MNTADKLLLIHMDSITHAAPMRRKRRYGHSMTLSIFLFAIAIVVFGRGIA